MSADGGRLASDTGGGRFCVPGFSPSCPAGARPTDQSYLVFKELSARLDGQLAKLGAALKSGLPAFNELLADRGLAPEEASDENR
jgi:hypothetical protein